MKYALFTNTPAHVHLYRNAVRELQADGHEVLVLARDYGCTVSLAEWYDLPFVVYGRCGTTKHSLLTQLPRHYARILREIRRFDPDLIFGIGAYAAHAGLLSRTPVILVHDSEPTSLDHLVSGPFARAILTPRSFRKDLGSNHFVFDGYKECAYLHPENVSPQSDIRDRLGLAPDERFAIVRFNAFGSHHDVGRSGFSARQRRELIEHLSESVTVFVSDESDALALEGLPARPFDVHPALLHDALAAADLLVADTQTMVTEAALLGTPAIRSNSFVGDDDMGNFLDLERAGLVRNVAEFDAVLDVATSLLTPDARASWRRRRDEFVEGTVNLTDVILSVAETPDRVERIPELSRRADSREKVEQSTEALDV
jgi:predicted glycosyltransferase